METDAAKPAHLRSFPRVTNPAGPIFEVTWGDAGWLQFSSWLQRKPAFPPALSMLSVASRQFQEVSCKRK